MKKFFAILAIAGTLTACNDAGNSAENIKDSIDSATSEVKDRLDSTTENRMDRMDSSAEAKKDMVDSMHKGDSAHN